MTTPDQPHPQVTDVLLRAEDALLFRGKPMPDNDTAIISCGMLRALIALARPSPQPTDDYCGINQVDDDFTNVSPQPSDAMRTYVVQWQRQGEDEIMRCDQLTPRVFFSRLIGAIKNSGPITVHAIAAMQPVTEGQ